jgi:hypothetical protein
MTFGSRRNTPTAKAEANPKAEANAEPSVKPRSGPRGPPPHTSDNRTMKMRLDFQLDLRRSSEEDDAMTWTEYCSRTIVSRFNEKEPRPLYKMFNAREDQDVPSRWNIYICYEEDNPDSDYCKSLESKVFRRMTLTQVLGTIRVFSPLFDVSSRSPRPLWRDSMREVSAYFRANPFLEADEFTSSSIWISIEPRFSLPEVRCIAQCGIHFEPAIEALMIPLADDGECYTSNWAMSWDFAPMGRTRPEAIGVIENAPNLAAVSALMQHNDPPGNFTWEFKHLGRSRERIEFYRCPSFDDAREAIRHIEFTLCFVRVAMRCPRDQLLRIPSNVGGVRWFLTRFREAWLHNCALLPLMWRGVSMDAMTAPRLPVFTVPQQAYIQENHLHDVEEMIRQDMTRCREFARNAQAPYF